MTQLFTRSGTAYNGKVGTNDKGQPTYTYDVACNRCHVVNGQRLWIMGMENGRPFSYTGFDCWTCGNTGVTGSKTAVLYTAEQLAKLDAAQAKRQATRQAKLDAAREVAERQQAEARAGFAALHSDFCQQLDQLQGEFWTGFRDSFYKRLSAPTERQVALVNAEVAKLQQNATSEHFGNAGDRVELTVTVERVIGIDTVYGTKWINILRCDNGNVAVHKGSYLATQGEQIKIKATVVDHTVRDGVKQTIVQRPKII